MSKFIDLDYLRFEQYKDSSNLNARIEFTKRFSTNPYSWSQWVFDILEKMPKQAHVFELGCGPGYMWVDCADRIPADWNIILSDLSEGMLNTARGNIDNLSHSFNFRQIDAQAIPFDEGIFDVVIAKHMLYHIPDRPRAISEIWRVLKPGGHLIATTAGDTNMKELYELIERVTLKPFVSFSNGQFTLENGMQQLTQHFSQVYLYHHENTLRITEIEPLMAYICSTIKEELLESALAEIYSKLEQELNSKAGEILVTKDTGLFDAIK